MAVCIKRVNEAKKQLDEAKRAYIDYYRKG